jgi:hypothetical protein
MIENIYGKSTSPFTRCNVLFNKQQKKDSKFYCCYFCDIIIYTSVILFGGVILFLGIYDGILITAIIFFIIFIIIIIAILRAVFRINDIVTNLEHQNAYQKAIYNKIKLWMKSQGIVDPDESEKQ